MNQQYDLFTGEVTRAHKQPPRPGKVTAPPGCDRCPLDKVACIRKVLGLDRIRRRRAMLWAQSPGRIENQKALELVGTSGQFLWKSLIRFGLRRPDFDIQNVIRCWPASLERGEILEHQPTKEELYHCSIHNDTALDKNAGAAVVHLVLGKVAAVQLFGKDFRKGRPIFWYEPWKAYVVYADHPAYITRLGGEAAGWKYREFLARLHAIKTILDFPGQFGFIKAQDYGAVTNMTALTNLEGHILNEAREGRRVSVDIEDGCVGGKRAALCMGFGWGQFAENGLWKGHARTVLLDHPSARLSPDMRQASGLMVKRVLESRQILKVLQHGTYDCGAARDLLGITMRGYDVDSQYASYLRWSYRKTYSLESMAQSYFTEFGDYKDLVAGEENLAEVLLATLVLYNCADADLTKRIEVVTAPEISLPLLRVYTDAARVLDQMEQRGPILDSQEFNKVNAEIPIILEGLADKLRACAEDPDFNPNAPPQIARLLFDKLGLPEIEGRSTAAEALQLLVAKTGNQVAELVLRYRYFSRMLSTYIKGYQRSAAAHGGQLRTRWNLTGTSTGRISSGGGEDEGVVNFQNLHSSPVLQNMLVSDPDWRRVLSDV